MSRGSECGDGRVPACGRGGDDEGVQASAEMRQNQGAVWEEVHVSSVLSGSICEVGVISLWVAATWRHDLFIYGMKIMFCRGLKHMVLSSFTIPTSRLSEDFKLCHT